jgi:hypothetical protein
MVRPIPPLDFPKRGQRFSVSRASGRGPGEGGQEQICAPLCRQRLFHGGEQIAIFLEGGELRELLFDVVGGMKKKSGVRFGQHGGVVEGIAGGDKEVLQGFQGDDGAALGVFLAQFVARDASFLDHQVIAENGGPFQLAHDGLGEFLKRVGQNDDLCERSQFAQKFQRAGQRAQRGDDFLDVGQLEAVLIEDFDAGAHEFVVIRFIAGGAAQFGDVGFFGDGNPNLRHEDAFQIQHDD